MNLAGERKKRKGEKTEKETIGVFTLVTRGWAASEFLTLASKFSMTPNGECQIIGPDRSHIFDARVTNVKTLNVFGGLAIRDSCGERLAVEGGGWLWERKTFDIDSELAFIPCSLFLRIDLGIHFCNECLLERIEVWVHTCGSVTPQCRKNKKMSILFPSTFFTQEENKSTPSYLLQNQLSLLSFPFLLLLFPVSISGKTNVRSRGEACLVVLLPNRTSYAQNQFWPLFTSLSGSSCVSLTGSLYLAFWQLQSFKEPTNFCFYLATKNSCMEPGARGDLRTQGTKTWRPKQSDWNKATETQWPKHKQTDCQFQQIVTLFLSLGMHPNYLYVETCHLIAHKAC